MPTLQDIRKRRFKTVRAFAQAGDMTMYQANNWLHARYGINYIENEAVAFIFLLFGVTLEEWRAAWHETAAEEKARHVARHTLQMPEQRETRQKDL